MSLSVLDRRIAAVLRRGRFAIVVWNGSHPTQSWVRFGTLRKARLAARRSLLDGFATAVEIARRADPALKGRDEPLEVWELR